MVAKHHRGATSSASAVADDPARVDTAMQQMIASVEERYLLREPEQVRTFLAAHPDVLKVVMQASTKTPEFLTDDAPILLEVVRDHEDMNDSGQVFAVVPTKLTPGQVRPKYDRLLREWLNDAGRRTGLLFNVDVEYR